MFKLTTIAWVFAALAVCFLVAVIWYVFLRLFGLADATIVDRAVISIFGWVLHLVL
ncbi:hypothetical protein JQT66_13850 [Sulfitobacter mediterraneus]|uniref:hypothetical protein n=1 Tax=Sulfitobacter mediterraneus TaxID=83219 RepID=UPI00193421D7|nr:hypothetical protein [Sulfitobacter mediterraneus]MBM1311324.1 hypothetical protein [Sulfitobacter mediterraneus]MBM1315206.1 hypothetical protein [Sulfitobacter mediterraneus]MBM1323567.1 hypothetical protein [Sulfitobacter mediterraneus]MBM1327479.1 hypothetical protein [Sulfitobacter mediterraneus]MBM1398827.1 hypothetical protein [Sulfitobacter mediterraneus]